MHNQQAKLSDVNLKLSCSNNVVGWLVLFIEDIRIYWWKNYTGIGSMYNNKVIENS